MTGHRNTNTGMLRDAMTRMEFFQIDLADVVIPFTLRSGPLVKWEVDYVGDQNVEGVPRMTKHAFTKTKEEQLPKLVVLTLRRKPHLLVRQIV